jgi:hypothetical protein
MWLCSNCQSVFVAEQRLVPVLAYRKQPVGSTIVVEVTGATGAIELVLIDTTGTTGVLNL